MSNILGHFIKTRYYTCFAFRKSSFETMTGYTFLKCLIYDFKYFHFVSMLGCTEDDDCPHSDEICDKSSNRCVQEPKCDPNNFPYESHDENSRVSQGQTRSFQLKDLSYKQQQPPTGLLEKLRDLEMLKRTRKNLFTVCLNF